MTSYSSSSSSLSYKSYKSYVSYKSSSRSASSISSTLSIICTSSLDIVVLTSCSTYKSSPISTSFSKYTILQVLIVLQVVVGGGLLFHGKFFWYVFLYEESASQKLREAEDNIHKNAQEESDCGAAKEAPERDQEGPPGVMGVSLCLHQSPAKILVKYCLYVLTDIGK